MDVVKTWMCRTFAIVGLVALVIYPLWIVHDCSMRCSDPLDFNVLKDPFNATPKRKALIWPMTLVSNWTTPLKSFINVQLFLLYGAMHSITVFPSFSEKVKHACGLSDSQYRGLYNFVAGITLVALMKLWVPLGEDPILEIPVGAVLGIPNYLVNLVLTNLFGLAAMATAAYFGIGSFTGLQKFNGNSSENETLVTTGLYGYVRHPMYMFQILMCLCTPVLSWDRVVLTLGIISYLFSIGLPMEEKKLISKFGRGYQLYSEDVPAVIPWDLPVRMCKKQEEPHEYENIAFTRSKRKAAAEANALRQTAQELEKTPASKRSTSKRRAKSSPRSGGSTRSNRSGSFSRRRKPKS